MKSLNRILIIEDSKSFSAVIVRLLKEEFETKVLHELDNGLEECQSFVPDIILLDIMFPGDIDGLSFLRMLKNTQELYHIPIILISALANESTIRNGLELGANDYLVKPFDLVQLVLKVKNLLDLTGKTKRRTLLETVVQFENSGKKKAIPTIEKIDMLLERMINGEKKISIESLAKEIPTSQSTLTRLIKAKYGLTTNNYIMKRKMEKANILLNSERGLPIKEIASILDFESVAYFTKCYKRYMGTLPKIARKSV